MVRSGVIALTERRSVWERSESWWGRAPKFKGLPCLELNRGALHGHGRPNPPAPVGCCAEGGSALLYAGFGSHGSTIITLSA